MVRFTSQPPPQPELEVEDTQLKSPKQSFDSSDNQATDFSFADSFLNLDSIQHWFDDKPIPDMAAPENDNNCLAHAVDASLQVVQGMKNGSGTDVVGSTHLVKVEEPELDRSDPHVVGSAHVVKVEEPEYENLDRSYPHVVRSTHEVKVEEPQYENLDRSTHVAKVGEPEYENLGMSGSAIEEGMEKIILVDGCGSSARIEGNGDIRSEVITNNENDDDDEGSESETSSTSCTSSTSSTSSSSDSEDEDDDNREQEQQDKKVEGCHVHMDLEEGEIRGSDREDFDERDAATVDVDDDDGGDYDEDNHAAGGPIKSKNELEILPSVPPVDVTLEPYHKMLPVGVIMSIMGAQVIVEGVEKHDPLSEGSVLWMTESRTPLGFIDEIFGPVRNPYYVVRYNSENEVPAGIHGGILISFVPEFANHVLKSKDLYKKGYDASGVNDEEVSEETEFSDDEKEAEYKRMQRMTKRGRKNNRKKVSPKEPKQGAVPAFPVTPVTHDPGHCSPFSGIGQGSFGANTANAGPNLTASGVCPPLFPPPNAGPAAGIWTNGITIPQPQSALLPYGFPTNGISWYPENTQIYPQLPVAGIPFQQQLNPGFPSTTLFPGIQPNILSPPMHAQGLVGQNQMTFGLSSPFPQIQPPVFAGQQGQGFFLNELQSETNGNLHSSSIPGNHPASHQFNQGASSSRGRRTFHRGRRKGQRPA